MHPSTINQNRRISRRSFALLGALLILLTFGPSPAATAADLTLEQVLAKYYEAIGGLDAWRGLKTMKQTGTMKMGPMEAPFSNTSERPNKLRIEFEIQGMKGIQAFDGENGWMLMPFAGSTEPEPMPKDMVDMIKNDAEIDGVLIDYEKKGHKVSLVGLEDHEGTPTWKLHVTSASGTESDYYLDAEAFVPIATRAKATIQGTELEISTAISDYKEVGGLMIPHSVVSKTPMGDQAITIATIELNVPVDATLFAMPPKSAPQP